MIAQRRLGRDVQPDGGLVEQQHARPVQQGRGDLAADALAEGELGDRPVQQRADIEGGGQPRQPRLMRRPPDVVDPAQELEAAADGKGVPELRALAEDDADAPRELAALVPGHAARHKGLARAGPEDAGQHLERRRLAGAVGADESDPLARRDGEGDVLHRRHLDHRPRPQEPGHGTTRCRARRRTPHPEALAQPVDRDRRHDFHPLSKSERAKKKPRRWCRAGPWSLSHVDPNYRMQKDPRPAGHGRKGFDNHRVQDLAHGLKLGERRRACQNRCRRNGRPTSAAAITRAGGGGQRRRAEAAGEVEGIAGEAGADHLAEAEGGGHQGEALPWIAAREHAGLDQPERRQRP